MERNYNYIYAKIVKADDDLIGHIAYSLYKKGKIEYIDKQKRDGKAIADEDLVAFNDISSSDSSINGYRIQAELILQGFIEHLLEEEIKDIEKETIKQHQEILKNIINPIQSFWGNVGAGLVSSFVFALVLAAIAFVLRFQGSTVDIKVSEKTQQEDTASTKKNHFTPH